MLLPRFLQNNSQNSFVVLIFVLQTRRNHPKWQFSEISWPVNIPRQQHLIDWKCCQHTHGEGVDCYRYVFDHMEIWSLWLKKRDLFQVVAVPVLLYGCTIWTLSIAIKSMSLLLVVSGWAGGGACYSSELVSWRWSLSLSRLFHSVSCWIKLWFD